MVTLTRAPDAALDPPTWSRIRDLAGDLQAVYLDAYRPAFDEALDTGSRFELPDGTRLDPSVAADTVACRAVNDALAAVVERHLPGAWLVGRADESPAVVASSWRYHAPDNGQLLELTIEWDCTYDFGDPAGLVVAVQKVGER